MTETYPYILGKAYIHPKINTKGIIYFLTLGLAIKILIIEQDSIIVI